MQYIYTERVAAKFDHASGTNYIALFELPPDQIMAYAAIFWQRILLPEEMTISYDEYCRLYDWCTVGSTVDWG